MSKLKRNIYITLALCLVWVAFVFYLTYSRYADNNMAERPGMYGAGQSGQAGAQVSAEELRAIGALVYDAPIALRDLELLDHNAAAFTPENLQGQWSLIFFGFTNCPDICPLTMHELGGFYRDLADGPYAHDTQVIMVSVDPFRDTTESVREYVKAYHQDFVGVTGEFGDISDFARQLFIAHSQPPREPETAGNYLIDHSGYVLMINENGDYIGFLESGIQRPDMLRAYNIIRSGGPG